jgi:hypothetical protein
VEWTGFLDTVAFVATAGGALAVAWGLLKLIADAWNATVGLRKRQRRQLNALFPGAHTQYVEGLLGYPTLVSHEEGQQSVRRFRLPDCWVSVGVTGSTIDWMSVTVTDPKFKFRTKGFTRGLLDLRLGHDRFDNVDSWFFPDECGPVLGQKEQRYIERTTGTTVQRSQQMACAYTNLGVGELRVDGDLNSPTLIRRKTTVNSLAISKPFADLPRDRIFLGRQEAQVVPLGRKRLIRGLVMAVQTRWRLARAQRRKAGN